MHTSAGMLIYICCLENPITLHFHVLCPSQAVNEFKFLPESGELRPLEQMKVVVQFTPKDVQTVHQTFTLEVEEGNTV